MQSNNNNQQTIINYPPCFQFRKWSLIIIISLDLLIIFYTTFTLIGRLQMLNDLDFDVGVDDYKDHHHNHNRYHYHHHYPELYNYGTNMLIQKNQSTWINETARIRESTESVITTTINPINLRSSSIFNVEIPTTTTTTTRTTISTEMDQEFRESNVDDEYNVRMEKSNANDDDDGNSSISSAEHSNIWLEMFEHRIYQRPKVCFAFVSVSGDNDFFLIIQFFRF